MDTEELLTHARRLHSKVKEGVSKSKRQNSSRFDGLQAQICELLRITVGEDSSFYQRASSAGGTEYSQIRRLDSVLEGFIEFVEADLHEDISPERRAQINVVSDFLDQAQALLKDKDVHPAPAAVLIGATLEEFLRTWIESEELSLDGRSRGLQNYAEVLYKEDMIEKQDLKDITSWGGIRNHAAHGEWEKVSNPEKAELMLQGVNLFIRKYSN